VVVHPIRESFLSALFGQIIARGVPALDDRIGDFGIDDTPALTEQEKSATIRNLLEA
jgi:CubicO group peptidase (beta-lactamase class C family)